MRLFRILFLLCFFTVANLFANENIYNESKPIIIIRFNNPEIYYDNAINIVIDKYINNNLSNIYIELSFSENSQRHKEVKSGVSNIINRMMSSGISKDNIHVTHKNSTGIDHDEIRIFVS